MSGEARTDVGRCGGEGQRLSSLKVTMGMV